MLNFSQISLETMKNDQAMINDFAQSYSVLKCMGNNRINDR